jgi:hypothetical protein
LKSGMSKKRSVSTYDIQRKALTNTPFTQPMRGLRQASQVNQSRERGMRAPVLPPLHPRNGESRIPGQKHVPCPLLWPRDPRQAAGPGAAPARQKGLHGPRV